MSPRALRMSLRDGLSVFNMILPPKFFELAVWERCLGLTGVLLAEGDLLDQGGQLLRAIQSEREFVNGVILRLVKIRAEDESNLTAVVGEGIVLKVLIKAREQDVVDIGPHDRDDSAAGVFKNFASSLFGGVDLGHVVEGAAEKLAAGAVWIGKTQASAL